MGLKEHSQCAEGSRHAPHNLTYPDATNREAGTNEGSGITVSSDHINMFALQDDNQSLWQLVDTVPTWRQVWTTRDVTVNVDTNVLQIISPNGDGEIVMADGTDSPRLVMGHKDNSITTGSGNAVLGGGLSTGINEITGANTNYATVVGGSGNVLDGNTSTDIKDCEYSLIVGGTNNTVNTVKSAIVGASDCTVWTNSQYSIIAGGESSRIGDSIGTYPSAYSFIAGGDSNTIEGNNSFIGAGETNFVRGDHSIAMGDTNNIQADGCTAIGKNITITHNGCFSVNDDSGSAFPSTTTRQFSADFTNGYRLLGGSVGVNTSNPSSVAQLDVNGTRMRLRSTYTPSTASSTGEVGTICWDSDYIYVCVATDTWKRVGISTW